MRAFRVTEDQSIGLLIRAVDGVAGIKVGTEGNTNFIPLCRELQDLLQDLHASELPTLEFADLPDEGDLRIIKQRFESNDALVHVATAPGIGGRLIYTSASWVKDERGRRRYRDFPSPGVEVVCFGGNEPEQILLLQAGASFRIVRTGDVGDAPRALRVVWTGTHLHVYKSEPKKQRTERAA